MKLYRVDGSVWSDCVAINVGEYYVHRETKCGYWISDHQPKGDELPPWAMWKWVSKTGRKRYAYPTIEEAIQSFNARKDKQRKILERQLSNTVRLHKFINEQNVIDQLMESKSFYEADHTALNSPYVNPKIKAPFV